MVQEAGFLNDMKEYRIQNTEYRIQNSEGRVKGDGDTRMPPPFFFSINAFRKFDQDLTTLVSVCSVAVTPAVTPVKTGKAGVQVFTRVWIPAFAGMTGTKRNSERHCPYGHLKTGARRGK